MFASGQTKLSPHLQNLSGSQQVTVVVQYKQMPANPALLLQQVSGELKATLDSVLDLVVTVPASALPGLANDPNVIYISADRSLQAAATPASSQAIGLDYHRESINLPPGFCLTVLGGGWR